MELDNENFESDIDDYNEEDFILDNTASITVITNSANPNTCSVSRLLCDITLSIITCINKGFDSTNIWTTNPEIKIWNKVFLYSFKIGINQFIENLFS